MSPRLTKLLAPLSSLRLTVALLALSMLLVFAGTWAQIDYDISTVQARYFHSFFTWIDLQLFMKRPAAGAAGFPGRLPLPGGYTLIILLLANLLAAHSVRFKFNRKRIGIILIHSGLIMLLVGEVFTSVFAREGQMTIDEGGSVNYAQEVRHAELAVIDPSPEDHDNVTVVPQSRLLQRSLIRDSKLPFDVHVDAFYANSQVLGPQQAAQQGVKDARATAGVGVGITAVERPKFPGTEAEAVDAPSAYVTLSRGEKSLGTYLVSLFIDGPQRVRVDGKDYLLQLRFKRDYKPYTIHLLKFSHDRYLGTDTPKNFASRIRLVDPPQNQDREALIWMNHPLRYGGETFYQQSFKPGDKTTVLQVVRNPGWLLPYVACGLGALGMLVHFGAHLINFILKTFAPAQAKVGTTRGKAQAQIRDPRSWLLPAGVTVACLIAVAAMFARASAPQRPYNLDAFGRIPVTYDGRTMPLDTLARNSLKIISGRERIDIDGGKQPAIRWLLDVMGTPAKAIEEKAFRIDHPELVDLLGLDPKRKLFSLNEVLASREKLQKQLELAKAVEPKRRDLFQRKIVELVDRVSLYGRLAELETLFLVPPLRDDEQWQTVGQAIDTARERKEPHPALKAFIALVQDYHGGRADEFNQGAAEYQDLLHQYRAAEMQKVDFEAFFNRFDPFTLCMALYVLVFILACGSWIAWARPLARTALCVLLVALVVHTFGLVSRIYISGRPPVTNLYSSAVFIAWGAVVLAAGLEALFRNGIGSAVAAIMGFCSLLIAQYLSADGDTMKQMQAVLDTNFWLATHVVVITLGYASTFLAGMIAVLYVLLGLFTSKLSADKGKGLARMTYGIICFAMLFSFVGTILGGIWADQSWGRFWGWDPKENGAVLIVLWNALILHARWSGLVRERGMMLLAIFGNVVTSWSWFGTNMLGIGLHSYGFMDSAFYALIGFVAVQLSLIAMGNIPLHFWRSFAPRTAEQLPGKLKAAPAV